MPLPTLLSEGWITSRSGACTQPQSVIGSSYKEDQPKSENQYPKSFETGSVPMSF